MNIKTFLFASATAALMGTSALAVTQDVIDAIVSDLSGQGYTRLEIKNYNGTAKVEAFGPNGKIERLYDASGEVIREERETAQGDTGGFPGAGSTSDDDEDDDNDGEDDDNDAGSDDDDDHGSHNSGSDDDEEDDDSDDRGSDNDDDDDEEDDDSHDRGGRHGDDKDDDNGGNDDD